MHDNKKPTRATIKVCLNESCCEKGAREVYDNLKNGFAPDEAYIEPAGRCLGSCEHGPNIAVNDNIVKGVKPFLAVDTVRRELDDPSCKADGLGSKSMEKLDEVLDSLDKL